MESLSYEDTKHRGIYTLKAKTMGIGAYDGTKMSFIGLPRDLSQKVLLHEFHSGITLGTASPLKYLGDVPEEIYLWSRYPGINCLYCGSRLYEHSVDGYKHNYNEHYCKNVFPYERGYYSPLYNLLVSQLELSYLR